MTYIWRKNVHLYRDLFKTFLHKNWFSQKTYYKNAFSKIFLDTLSSFENTARHAPHVLIYTCSRRSEIFSMFRGYRADQMIIFPQYEATFALLNVQLQSDPPANAPDLKRPALASLSFAHHWQRSNHAVGQCSF